MKRDRSIIISGIWLLTGALLCYFLVQFTYLDIDTEVNVVETILSVATAGVGLYIASTLQKSHNRNQKLSDYLQSKHDKTWDVFFNFSTSLDSSSAMQLADINKTFKTIDRNLASQRKIFNAFEVKEDNLDAIDKALDELEDILMNQTDIADNVVNYQKVRDLVQAKTDQVATAFADTLRDINRIN